MLCCCCCLILLFVAQRTTKSILFIEFKSVLTDSDQFSSKSNLILCYVFKHGSFCTTLYIYMESFDDLVRQTNHIFVVFLFYLF